MEDKEEMSNLTRINLIISQSLTQTQEAILVLSGQLQTLQAQINSKKPATEKPETEKKNVSTIQIAASGLVQIPAVLTIPAQHATLSA